ncbi:geranylgeranyl pyrophosphate synthase [Lasiosphaeris hirsuta]|uniref:Geranylgeranyl pyrophosphate synthase n=1 Tax=Lasiosphaeris hirsuta TaxID=260670 RepID=A0AA39ZSE1_9PEZI|nr:geranylgeranyl pyrophosphate synthase [Lasiosphaeris hirsuta]
MDNDIFGHCKEVDRDQLNKSKSFTILPVRIHTRNDIADAACLALSRDWGSVVGDGREKIFHGAISPTGNWNAFIFPECLPDRLGLISYIGEVGMLHDDACEEMSVEEARTEHEALATALDPQGATSASTTKDTRNNKLKTLVSQAILESFRLGHGEAMEMLNIYRNEWLRVMEHDNTDDIKTLDEYFYHRARNGGMGSYWNLFSFGMNIRLSADDEAMIADLKQISEQCFLLTNDYFSWEREFEQSASQDQGKVFNAVWFLMSKNGLTEEGARERVRSMISDLEAEYLSGRSKLLAAGDVPSHVRKWLGACAVAMGGNHYWCSTCPRQNDWHSAPRLPPTDQVSVAELIGLASRDSGANSGGQQRRGYPSPESDQPTHQGGDSAPTISPGALDAPGMIISRTNAEDTSALGPGSDEGHLSDTVVMAPTAYISSLPSKGVRTLLIEAVNTWLDVPADALSTISSVIDSLHNSSLMLDDIEDSSPLRRGHPSTHAVFGSAQTINSATYLYVRAVTRIMTLHNSTTAVSIVLEELEHLFIGQSWDLYWTFHSTVPSRKDYLAMIGAKTGGLFRMLLRLMACASPLLSVSEAGSSWAARLDTLARAVGRFFQIRDDYMNLVSADYTTQKGFAEDLDEGKFSYPLIVALSASGRARDHVLGILRSKMPGQTLAIEAKRYVLGLMEETGSLRETGELLASLEHQIESEIVGLEGLLGRPNPMLRLLLKTLSVKSTLTRTER